MCTIDVDKSENKSKYNKCIRCRNLDHEFVCSICDDAEFFLGKNIDLKGE